MIKLYDTIKEEYAEMVSLTNPAVKRGLIKAFVQRLNKEHPELSCKNLSEILDIPETIIRGLSV